MHVRQSPAVCPVPLFHIYSFLPSTQTPTLTCLHSARGAAGPLRCFDAAHLWQLGWGSSALDLPVDTVPLGEGWTCLAPIPWASDSTTQPVQPSHVRRCMQCPGDRAGYCAAPRPTLPIPISCPTPSLPLPPRLLAVPDYPAPRHLPRRLY